MAAPAVSCPPLPAGGRLFLRRNFSWPPGYRLRRRAGRMSPRAGGFSYGWDLSGPLRPHSCPPLPAGGRFGLSCGRNFSRPAGYRLRRRASRMSPRSGGFSCGWDLSSPLENIVVPGAEFLRARRSLFSPLSRSLPPPPAAVALQAHDLLRRPLGSLRTIKTKNNKGRPIGAPLVVFVSRRRKRYHTKILIDIEFPIFVILFCD